MCFIHVLVLRVGCQAKYTGMIHCFRKVMAEEGFTGLYRVALSPIAGAMAHNANVFFSYSLAKKVVGSIHHRDHTDLTIAQLFAAGSMAGAVISVVETPVDLFKIKLQRQGLHVRAWHGCRRAVHTTCSPTLCHCWFLDSTRARTPAPSTARARCSMPTACVGATKAWAPPSSATSLRSAPTLAASNTCAVHSRRLARSQPCGRASLVAVRPASGSGRLCTRCVPPNSRAYPWRGCLGR